MGVYRSSGHHHRSCPVLHVHLPGLRPSDVEEIKINCSRGIWRSITVRTASIPFPSFCSYLPVSSFSNHRRTRVIIASGLHLHYLHLQMLSANPTLAGAYTVVCAQLELGYGLMASSVPCLKPFMSAFEGPFRPPQKSSNPHSTDYPFNTYGSVHSKQLRSASDHRIGGSAVVGLSSADEQNFRPDGGMYQATVSHRDQGPEEGARGGGERASIDSGDSRQLIIKKDMVIKKEVKWSVEREDGGAGGRGEREKDADMIVRIEERSP